MATKFYFRNIIANDPKPSAKASTDTDSFTGTPADKNTCFMMLRDNPGTAATSVAGAYTTATTPLYTMMRMFVSDPLMPGAVITGGDTLTIAIAQMESNNQMNLYFRHFVYVRSEAGTNVKTILGPQSDPTEEGNTRVGCVHSYTANAGDYTIQRGDRLVHEWWADIRNTRNSSYTATIYFDGTTDPQEGVASTNEASYLQFNQDLRFWAPRPASVNFL